VTVTKSRFSPRSLAGLSASLLPYDHEAVVSDRTVYPTTVQLPVRSAEGEWVLKKGTHNRKIGGEILKGKWKGFPTYTLTLEERASCPKSCSHWRSCYGNHMQWPHRFVHGKALEWRLEREVAILSIDHSRFAIRLHELGDFYSVAYVALWRRLIERHDGLHCFGFTARQKDDPIGAALISLVNEHWDRFAIRFSNAPEGFEAPSTKSIEHEGIKPPDAIVCPQQLGKTESCSTCALCWHSRRRIAFLQH
jgi:hypothetical protein